MAETRGRKPRWDDICANCADAYGHHFGGKCSGPKGTTWKPAAEPSRGAPDFLHRIEQAEQESGLTQSQENLLHDLHQYFAGGHVVLLEALRRSEQYIGGHKDENGELCIHRECNKHNFRLISVLDQIRAAIKQAERTGEKK